MEIQFGFEAEAVSKNLYISIRRRVEFRIVTALVS